MSEQGAAGASAPIFNEIKISEKARKYTYKSAKILANAVLIFGSINCISALAHMGALLGQWKLLQKMGDRLFSSRQDMMSAATQSDAVVRLFAMIFLVTLILTYIAGGMWIYRAARNVRAAGARGLENSPGWAVGWYFVPFACLLKPFEAMVEIWKASYSPERWKTRPTPGLLRWWWGLWLVTNVFGWIANGITKAANTIPSLIFETQFQMIDSVLDIASTVVFLVIVLQITRMQAEAPATTGELAATFS